MILGCPSTNPVWHKYATKIQGAGKPAQPPPIRLHAAAGPTLLCPHPADSRNTMPHGLGIQFQLALPLPGSSLSPPSIYVSLLRALHLVCSAQCLYTLRGKHLLNLSICARQLFSLSLREIVCTPLLRVRSRRSIIHRKGEVEKGLNQPDLSNVPRAALAFWWASLSNSSIAAMRTLISFRQASTGISLKLRGKTGGGILRKGFGGASWISSISSSGA
jgi:hypothetical protein